MLLIFVQAMMHRDVNLGNVVNAKLLIDKIISVLVKSIFKNDSPELACIRFEKNHKFHYVSIQFFHNLRYVNHVTYITKYEKACQSIYPKRLP